MKRNITRTAIIITIIAMTVKLFGFVKELVLAYYFGTDYIADGYLLSISLPVIFFGWLSSVALAYIPIYTAQSISNRHRYTIKLHSVIVVLSCVCIVIGEIIAPILVGITSPGLDLKAHTIAIEYFRVALLSLLFMPITEINIANLNCEGHYVSSNVINMFFGSIQIFFIIYSGLYDYHSLIWGYTISSGIRFIVSVWFCVHYGLKPGINFEVDKNVKETFQLGIPMIVSQLVAQINSLLDRALASFLHSGAISILSYGNTLKNFAYSVFTLAADTIIFPVVSKCVAEDDYKKMYMIERSVLQIMAFVLLPITVYLCCNAQAVVFIVFYRGAFSYSALAETSNTFITYIAGLYPIALTEIIIRMYYAMNDSKTPLKISGVSIALNGVLSIIMMKLYGTAGIALATSIASLVVVPIYLKVLNAKIQKRVGENIKLYTEDKKKERTTYFKQLIALLCMATVLLTLPKQNLADMTALKVVIWLCIKAIFSFGVYVIACFVLKMEQIRVILDQILRRK